MTTYQTELQTMRQLCSPAIKPGLERMAALLAVLDNPQNQLQNIIHVGGTNGKGSVCALLEAILLADGKTVGLYTSPHLHNFRERLRLNGQMITEAEITPLLQKLNAALSQLYAENSPHQPTEFEAATALGFLFYAQTQPDWLILEVGMGGRFDATNMVNAPFAVLTNIGRDHMEFLGDTIIKIAGEKAGIIKPNATIFTAAEGEAWQVFAASAFEQGAHLLTLGLELQAEPLEQNEYQQQLSLITPHKEYKNLQLSLLGAHQVTNAALAVACAEAIGMPEAAIRQGLQTAHHPARLEILQRQPLILLDGAHNEHGMAALAQSLGDYWPQKRILALFGMLADKEREAALAHLLPHLAAAIVSRPPVMHRSEDWARLADVCAAGGVSIPPENIIEDIPTACERALELLPEYDMLLVCGSLYLVAEARAYLRNRIKNTE